MSWGKWTMVSLETNNNETRMNAASDMDIEMFCALPDGTELVMIKIAPLGIGMSMTGITMNQGVREAVTEYGNESGETTIGFAAVLYVLPDDYLPDPDEMVNVEFSKLGMRHGREGSPMFSESLLRAKHEDTWHDGAYAAYVNAYKLGSGRKGS